MDYQEHIPPTAMMGKLVRASAQQGQPNEGAVLQAMFDAFKPGTRNSGLEAAPAEFQDIPQELAGRLRQARQMSEALGKPGDGRTFTAGIGIPDWGLDIRVRYKAGANALLLVREHEQNAIHPQTGQAVPNLQGQNGPSKLFQNWEKRGLVKGNEYKGDGYYSTAAYEITPKGEYRRIDPRTVPHTEFGLPKNVGPYSGTEKPSFKPTAILPAKDEPARPVPMPHVKPQPPGKSYSV